ncbi:MAG: DUF255 domain-containing protein [Paracoccaceae bacterium]
MKFMLCILVMIASSVQAEETRTPNHLLGQDSPYLQQHLYNPVDWYPWGKEALEKAKSEGKPIFLSIGYSSCHWCHVMEEESFENPEIAAYLNENFVAIKVDRETRPDLDEQFMLVTQALTGSGGWPNSVFLTDTGDPFHAGTYFPPDAFSNILERIARHWRNNGDTLAAEAAELSVYIRDYMARSTAADPLTPKAVRAAARSIIPYMDEFSGGMGDTTKFPQESLHLFLLDQAIRDGDTALLEVVINTLDGMIMGGIHDHVGGGFHRYSVDPEWHVPHFEKMLYNQAMTGRLLVKTWQVTGQASYRHAAERTFDYVLREMQAPSGGFYTAQDADSLDAQNALVEGAFYIWTPAEIQAVADDADFLIKLFDITEPGLFEGANVLHMLDLPEDAANLSVAAFFEKQDSALEILRIFRSNRPAPFKDRKIIVDWNAMMIATLAEAANSFSRPDYYEAAENAAQFITGTMLDGTDLHRTSMDGVASVPAQLTDYAALGLGLIALHDFAPDQTRAKNWLHIAEALASTMITRFIEADGSYRMTTMPDGIGTFRPFEDTEIPAGNALALALLASLSNRASNPEYIQQATLLEATIAGAAAMVPIGRSYTLLAAQNLTLGDTSTVRYLSGGAIRVEVNRDKSKNQLQLQIRLADGWHINAHTPLEEYFVPTELVISGAPLNADKYPKATIKSLGFNTKELALYEGTLTLTAPLTTGEAVLTLQACSDEICLAPEVLTFRVW